MNSIKGITYRIFFCLSKRELNIQNTAGTHSSTKLAIFGDEQEQDPFIDLRHLKSINFIGGDSFRRDEYLTTVGLRKFELM